LTLDSGIPIALLWENGALTELGSNCLPLSINNQGQIVGGTDYGEYPCDHHALFWEDHLMTDLGTFGGKCARAEDINEQGQIVGYSSSDGWYAARAILWENGAFTELDTPANHRAHASAINDYGQIVGRCDGVGYSIPFLWEDGTIYDLGDIGGVAATPVDINNYGQVAGYGLPADSNWLLWTGSDINNEGQIIGQAKVDVDGDGSVDEYHSFLLTPVVEIDIDIKPQSCPNPLNTKSKGVLPVGLSLGLRILMSMTLIYQWFN